MNKSYYDLLGVKSSSSADEIKKAYREKAHRFHPDKNSCDSYTLKFQEINEAYEILGNPEKRRVYDNIGDNDYAAILQNDEENYEGFFNFFDIEELQYDTDSYNLSCDCEEWIKKRSIYGMDDPRRLCKHLILEFQVPELQKIILPEPLKPFEKEILLNRYQKNGFTIYKELISFKSSFVSISDDDEKISIYIKEHSNPNCLFSRFTAYRDADGIYLWRDDKGETDELEFKSSDRKISDAKDYINRRFDVKNRDIILCQSHTQELLKEKINAYNAFQDGYLMSKHFEYSIPNYVKNNNIGEAIKTKERYNELKLKELFKFDTSVNLLSEYESRFTPRSFNKKLLQLGYIVKDKSLNNNNWILKGEGLKYGMNYIYDSKYTHIKTPKWYVLNAFDFTTLSFREEKRYGLKRMTRIMFKRESFVELLELMNMHISSPKEKKQKAQKQQEERMLFVKLQKKERTFFQILKDAITS